MPGPFDTVESGGGIVVENISQSSVTEELAALETKAQGMQAPEDATTAHGMCKALSTRWIINSATGNDYWSDLKDQDTLATMKLWQHAEDQAGKAFALVLGVDAEDLAEYRRNHPTAVQMQLNGIKALNPGKAQALDKALQLKKEWAPNLIKKLGHMTAEQDSRPPTNAADMVDMAKKVNGYSLLNLTFGDGDAHTVAMHHNPKAGVFFMDPNHGEVYFPDAAKFEHWFTTTLCADYATKYKGIVDCSIDRFQNAKEPQRPEYARKIPGTILHANQSASQSMRQYHAWKIEKIARLGELPHLQAKAAREAQLEQNLQAAMQARGLAPKPSQLAPPPSQLAPKPPQLAPKPSQLAPKPSQLAPKPSQLAPKPSH